MEEELEKGKQQEEKEEEGEEEEERLIQSQCKGHNETGWAVNGGG